MVEWVKNEWRLLIEGTTRAQLVYLVLCACACLGIGVIGYISITTSQDVAVQQKQLSQVAADNHSLALSTDTRLDVTNDALCHFYSDLSRRVAQTEHFLAHPEEFPSFNDPKTLASIAQQLKGQQATLDSLSGLPCGGP